jgi:hypothetical protein
MTTATEKALLEQGGFRLEATSHTDSSWERWVDRHGVELVVWSTTVNLYAPKRAVVVSLQGDPHKSPLLVAMALKHVAEERQARPDVWGTNLQ